MVHERPGAHARQPAHPFQFQQQEATAVKLEHETKRLQANAALQERNLQAAQARFAFKPRCTDVQQLLDRGGQLEDAGLYAQAVKCYQRALAAEPEHHELRQYIALLDLRHNALTVIDKQAARSDVLAVQLAGEAEHMSLHVPSAAKQHERPRGKGALGYAALPTPHDYGEALRKQAAEDAAARERARKHEERLNQQVLDHAAAMRAHEKHHRHVAVGNAKLQLMQGMQEQLENRRKERARQWELEACALQPAADGVLGGFGEREQLRAAHLAHPSSAQQQRQQQQQQQQHRPHTADRWAVAAPFARPGVDAPVKAISPQDVRARQQAFYDKHRKLQLPERIGQRHVTPANHQRPVDWHGLRADQITKHQHVAHPAVSKRDK